MGGERGKTKGKKREKKGRKEKRKKLVFVKEECKKTHQHMNCLIVMSHQLK
jgi:hypothetical protein